MLPPSALGFIPCKIAFSTIGSIVKAGIIKLTSGISKSTLSLPSSCASFIFAYALVALISSLKSTNSSAFTLVLTLNLKYLAKSSTILTAISGFIIISPCKVLSV